jgi:hypothetical protein
MTPSEIKQYITKQSEAAGVEPSLSLGLAELSGFSPNWTDGRRAGIMSLNKDYIADFEGYKKDPSAQVDAGVLMLSKSLEASNNNEFAALTDYTQSSKNSLKAFLRTARNRGDQVTEEEVTKSIQALGLNLNAAEEAQKAGLIIASPKSEPIQSTNEPVIAEPTNIEPILKNQTQQPIPQQQLTEQQQPLPDELPSLEQYEEPINQSTKEQRQKRVNAVFGGKETSGDVPEDLLLFIKGLV